MEQLYEYLIGGRKTGKIKKDGKIFGEICPGDILYVWNFDGKGKLLRKILWEVEEVKKTGDAFIFAGMTKDYILNSMSFTRSTHLPPKILLKYKDVSIYVWDNEYGAITTYDDEELVRMAVE